MRIIELNADDFESFASNHQLRNYCQTAKYGKLMGEKGFSYEFIGYTDDSNNLVAASLILIKRIGPFAKFAYAPKGFLIDYLNTGLVTLFTKDLFARYKRKGVAFIKINPDIIIAQLDLKNAPAYNATVSIIDNLKNLGYRRRREIEPLSFMFPRINPYINLKTFSLDSLPEDVRLRLSSATSNGLTFETATSKEINILEEFIKDTVPENINFYRTMLNLYGDDAEFVLIKANYEECLINAKNRFEKEQDNNSYLNDLIQSDNTPERLEEKMESDRRMIQYKNELVTATELLRKNKYAYVAAAVIVKYMNRVSIVVSGMQDADDSLFAYHYMISELINRYSQTHEFLELDGLASNFSTDSIYAPFNKARLDFNPLIFEYIGEFDLVINEGLFRKLQAKSLLSKEFLPSHIFKQ